MTNRFTDKAKDVISGAIAAAREFGHTYVGTEHLLLAITKTSPACFEGTQITYEHMLAELKQLAGTPGIVGGEDLTPKCKKILISAGRHAADMGFDDIDVEHILLALLGEECVAKRMIEMEGVSVRKIIMSLGSDGLRHQQTATPKKASAAKKAAPTPCLDRSGRDLTALAADGLIEGITGRESEEDRIIRILLRKGKNNPCLVGEAGVGKTAVVESLAKRIAEGRVPAPLKDMRLIAVDIAGVVAGTKYRGEFEEKVKSIIDEARNENIILFIDEMHTIVGAGSAEGSVDAANILKPYLARGEIKLIGATTPNEYRRIIAKDNALERRFQVVELSEPGSEECVGMINAIKKYYESHHGIGITESAVRDAVRISVRFMTGRRLPDKAIDIIDEAAAEASLRGERLLDSKTVTEIASSMVGVPEAVMSENRTEAYEAMRTALRNSLTGQCRAADSMADAYLAYITRSFSAKAGSRPVGMVLAGANGTGRGYAAEVFVKAAGFSEIIRLDMSSFTEAHSISGLIGSPPGYSGYDSDTSLAERIRRSPYSAIIITSFERAHPDVAAVISRILDDGTFTDYSGKNVSFANSFIIIAVSPSCIPKAVGFSARPADSAPEGIVSKADCVARFVPFTPDGLYAIAASRFGELTGAAVSERLAEHIRSKLDMCASAAECVRIADRLAAEACKSEGFSAGDGGELCADFTDGAIVMRSAVAAEPAAKSLFPPAKHGI